MRHIHLIWARVDMKLASWQSKVDNKWNGEAQEEAQDENLRCVVDTVTRPPSPTTGAEKPSRVFVRAPAASSPITLLLGIPKP